MPFDATIDPQGFRRIRRIVEEALTKPTVRAQPDRTHRFTAEAKRR